MESVVNNQLVNHMERNQLFSHRQFGFRRGLGTSDLLTALHHEWMTVLGQGGLARVLAVDIAGAFDKVSHPGVLHKAHHYGIRGPILNWLASYLSNRHLRAVVGGQASATFPVSAGVPQGSILGPTLFLIYTNDAEKCLSPGTDLAVYADDTTMYSLVRTSADAPLHTNSLQASVDALCGWGARWHIKFEPTKSQAMCVTKQRAPWPTPSLIFDGTAVAEDNSVKLLGVTFDRLLSFRDHLRSVTLRANQRIGLLRKAARVLDYEGRLATYKGFVRPLMEYAPLVWMGAASSHLLKLDKVQRRALHIIGPQTLLPSLSVRRTVSAMTYLYKLQCIDGPPQLLALIPPLRDHSDIPRTRADHRVTAGHDKQLLSPLPAASPAFMTRAFPYCIIDEWNQLPPNLLASSPRLKSIQTFKCKVYHHLLHKDWLAATDAL